MHYIHDLSDERNKAWCVHCKRPLTDGHVSRDHVPSKALLKEPYPANLPNVPICRPCNESFSRDEEYFVAFLGCVLSGSTDPHLQSDPRVSHILSRSKKLRERIDQARIEKPALDGAKQVFWAPEPERINRVILKNARGHAFYEYGEPMLDEPTHVWFAPLSILTAGERFRFEHIEWNGLLPELGSRMFTRVFTGHDLVEGWVQVQEGSYRYMVAQHGAMLVRAVVAEYLATEVYWQDV